MQSGLMIDGLHVAAEHIELTESEPPPIHSGNLGVSLSLLHLNPFPSFPSSYPPRMRRPSLAALDAASHVRRVSRVSLLGQF